MYPSKLGTMVAILATAAGFSALAGTAEAQISGTIGGDIVAGPVFDATSLLTPVTVPGRIGEGANARVPPPAWPAAAHAS